MTSTQAASKPRAAAKRIVLQITAGCAGGRAFVRSVVRRTSETAAVTADTTTTKTKQVSSGNACSVQRAKHG